MARGDDSFWFTLGRTLEEVRALLPSAEGSGGKKGGKRRKGKGDLPAVRSPLSGVLAGAVGSVGTDLVRKAVGGRRPPMRRILRGAVAGAGAAVLLHGLRVFLDREDDAELLDELLAGAGRGVIYAALLDPFLPGPPVVRGALAGTAEYVAAPWGGVFARLQSLSPARKIPLVSILLEAGDAEDDPYLSFLFYGVALGLLHGDD